MVFTESKKKKLVENEGTVHLQIKTHDLYCY